MLDKTTISGDDLAIGIQFTMQFPENRAVAFTTACPQDIAADDLDLLLGKLATAADKLDATYRLRALRKLAEHFEKELQTTRQQIANYEQTAAEDYERRGRKGPVQLTASQDAALKNFRTTQEGTTNKIKQLREEIKELEALTKVA